LVSEVARKFGVSRNVIYRAIMRGEVPIVPLGKRSARRIPKVWVDNHLAGE
jgi:excisionase family DNA binding protein